MTDTITAAYEAAARAAESFALVTRQLEDELDDLTHAIETTDGAADSVIITRWAEMNAAVNARLPIKWKLQRAANDLFDARNAATVAKVAVR